MDYIVSLNNIFVSDENKVGKRAVGLATLARNQYKIPMSIALNANAMELFIQQNGLHQKGADLIARNAHDQFAAAIEVGVLPQQLVAELREAYETLSVSEGADAGNIVSAAGHSPVNLIISPNYPISDFSGIIQNVRNLEQLAEAIKKAWASLFTKAAFDYREKNGIKEFFVGLMIQKMPNSMASALSSTTDEKIKVETYFGYPEFGQNFGKDYFELSKEYLSIDNHKINNQAERLTLDENGTIEKVPQGEHGLKQKVDDKVVLELARQAKKANILLKKNVTLYFTMDKTGIQVLFADEAQSEPPAPAPETMQSTPMEEKVLPSFQQPTNQKSTIPSMGQLEEKPNLQPVESKPSLPTETKPNLPPMESQPSLTPMGPPGTLPEGEVPEPPVEGTTEEEEDFLEELEKTEAMLDSPEEHSAPQSPPNIQIDEKQDHVDSMKDMLHELGDLMRQGDHSEIQHKLNELDRAVRKLRELYQS